MNDEDATSPLDGLPVLNLLNLSDEQVREMVQEVYGGKFKDHVVIMVSGTDHIPDTATLRVINEITHHHSIVLLPVGNPQDSSESLLGEVTVEAMLEKIHQQALKEEEKRMLRSRVVIAGGGSFFGHMMQSLAIELVEVARAVEPVIIYQTPSRMEGFIPQRFPRPNNPFSRQAGQKIKLPVFLRRGRQPHGMLSPLRHEARTLRSNQQGKRKKGRRNGSGR